MVPKHNFIGPFKLLLFIGMCSNPDESFLVEMVLFVFIYFYHWRFFEHTNGNQRKENKKSFFFIELFNQ
jgi:hypothetical protein